MKVKAISRSASSTSRQCSGDVRVRHRNLDPSSHPMQRAREYARAVSAAKLDRMFAAPFLGALDGGHRDGVTAAATSRNALVPFVSGCADGEVRIWDLASRKAVAELGGGHSRAVTGLTFDGTGRNFYSCSDDGLVRLWNVFPTFDRSSSSSDDEEDEEKGATPHGPRGTWRTPGSFKSIDHSRSEDLFATASDSAVCVWSPDRSSPVQSHEDLWGSDDTVNVARYNPSERSLLACCTADRGVGLFDTRTTSALKKTILAMRSNCLEWNPMEPMNFVVGNEDHSCYGFDARKLDRPLKIYKGHVGAVLSVSWSPTGREFASGSYDKTVRIFRTRDNASRDMYHLKRMQRVFTVNYSADDRYIISGSDDSNLRVWKARASEKIGQATAREERAVEYRQALVKKYQHLPEVRRIHKQRKAPKLVKKITAQVHLQKESARRKHENRVKHSKEGTVKHVADRDKTVVKQVE
uniref:Sof1-like protein domain-containing protein n=1 Tax=Trieres chinensis TaxID=1514140 RepID=A0A7S2A1T2_TRICV|mmetsp:Transcript_37911/g.77360  ORF Transcript_37911/g.77360 Transcript_37911/m.77360 type:complete len:467 (+) Transcript_37911:168-1568(+)|eukprot:CAMPEP_0183316576 /NCGR_PEP_ID=MMETSP0160_2-20130417/55407_1 /TAXON_ID=2839 ORGANISM="Odontella Sinensis, Strain Grunow 1884" /NCGR_SAMPLE_ID=MMETSP0160_2 /ASSEMBLY_ACC=CAM_ASM_000250 /LENGTH=466 /DNA_ID=CAMNT_0025482415 /DNA_START=117 /DNA_END=1517 /DNA_ORIENTATION=-